MSAETRTSTAPVTFLYFVARKEHMDDNVIDTFNSELGMLKTVTDSIPVGLCYIHKRKFLWVNKFMLKLTGYTQRELLGAYTRMIYESDEEYERMEKMLSTTLNGVITNVVCKNGKKVKVMIHAISNTPLYGNIDFNLPIVKTFSVIPDEIADLIIKGCS
jgi:PAS domain S-box-containing protein